MIIQSVYSTTRFVLPLREHCLRSTQRTRGLRFVFCRLQNRNFRGQKTFLSCSKSEGSSSAEDAAIASDLKTIEQLDRLIDALLACKSREELAKMVGENLLSLKQNFWLRLAARADTEDPGTREKMESLSRAVMTLTEAMVKMAESQLQDSSDLVTKILTSAADEKGEWEVPLAPDRIAALKQALSDNKDRLDEGFLATLSAWIRKSAEDKVQGMVPLLQRVLQLYAAQRLQESDPNQVGVFLNNLMEEDPSTWCSAVKTATASGILRDEEFNRWCQMKLEKAIELPGGSYEQRVQVEFLSELREQGQKAFEKKPSAE